MAIATGTALTLAAMGASAAGSAIKAKKQSTAAKKAAEQQQQGTGRASGFMREGMGQLSQLYAPYVNSGASAMGTLGRLTTPGPAARYASPGPPNAMPQSMSPYGQNPDAYRFAVPRESGGMSGLGSYERSGMGGYGRGGKYGRNEGPPPEEIEGPYMMAEGGDMMVDRPTMFVAGEAGPERATFTSMGQGGDIRDALLQQYAPQPPDDAQMQMPDGEPVAGPYPMATGGDVMVNRPTMFLAGEAGPERATFRPQTPPPPTGRKLSGPVTSDPRFLPPNPRGGVKLSGPATSHPRGGPLPPGVGGPMNPGGPKLMPPPRGVGGPMNPGGPKLLTPPGPGNAPPGFGGPRTPPGPGNAPPGFRTPPGPTNLPPGRGFATSDPRGQMPHVAGSVRANAARAQQLQDQQRRQEQQIQQQLPPAAGGGGDVLRAPQGDINPNGGIAGGLYGEMAPDAGPWGGMGNWQGAQGAYGGPIGQMPPQGPWGQMAQGMGQAAGQMMMPQGGMRKPLPPQQPWDPSGGRGFMSGRGYY